MIIVPDHTSSAPRRALFLSAVFFVGAITTIPARADFTLLMRDATNGISNTTAGQYLLAQPSSPNGGWTFIDYTESPNPAVIDVSGGSFSGTNLLPNGASAADTYALKATANLLIPAGTWTIGFGSDDGGSLKIPGITFTSRFNNSGSPVANEVRWETGRGHKWTGGTFTLEAPLSTSIEAMMYENTSGDSWEIGFASGTQTSFSTSTWSLLQDGVNGWTVQVDPIADLTAPEITDFSPADDATGISRSAVLVASFDEDIALTGSGSITLVDLTNGTPDTRVITLPDASVTVSGSELTIVPASNLPNGTEYAVQITSNAIKDLSTDNGGGANAFSGITDTTTWSFTTVPFDGAGPAIISTNPADNAINVVVDSDLIVTFDKPINLGTGNIDIYDVAGAAVLQTIAVTDASQVSISGDTLIINPSINLAPSKELAIQWNAAGIVKNYSDVGNAALSGTTAWSFTTASAELSTSVAILNHGFEITGTTVNDGAFGPLATSWSIHTDYGTMNAGTWNPSSSQYTNQVPEGDNIAYIEPTSANTQAGFSQVLTEEFINGPDYRLKVKVGQSIPYGSSGYRVQLLAGEVLLAEDVNSMPLSQDSFVEVTVDYLFDPANASLSGEPLEIRLLTLGYPYGLGFGTDFDDVRLSYGYSAPLANPGGAYVVSPTYDLFLNGSGSRASDGATITLYEWDLNNDGTFGDVANVAQPVPGGISDTDLFSTHGMSLGDNTIALRITDSSGKTSTVSTNVRIDLASVTPGVDFMVEADEDQDGDDRWEDLVAGNPSGLEILLDDSPVVSRVAVTSGTQISYAYDFLGGSTGNEAGALLVQTGTTTARSFQNAATGDWSGNAMSMEIWLKPDGLPSTPTNGQIIFEDGGGSGLGLFIADGSIVCSQDASEALISYNLNTDPSGLLLGPPTDEFIQVVVTRVAAGATLMYINGQQVGSASDDDSDWSGGDAAGFGTRGAANVGGLGSGQMSTESFDGKIGIIRVYDGQVLTGLQVLENFNVVNSPDVTAPFVEATTPDDGETGVFITTDLTATFDSDVQLTGAGTVILKNLDDGSGASDLTISLPDSQVSLVGRDLIINLTANLAFGTNYAVRISNDTITDTADTPNPFPGIVDNTSWNFSTLAQDLSPPVIIGMIPRDNAVGVSAVGGNLVATFDDSLLMGSGDIVITDLDDGSTTQTIAIGDASQVSITDHVLTVTPANPLSAGKPYSVRIASTALTNTSYLAFAGIADDTTWDFIINTPLFFDDFENPDVTAVDSGSNTSQEVDTNKWVPATQGYGASRCGIIDEDAGDFTDPTGKQAFAFRYTNSGVTSKAAAIGNLLAGLTYRVSFDVVIDRNADSQKAYNCQLLAVASGSTLVPNDVRSNGDAVVLASATGDAPAGGAYQTVSFEYTASAGNASIGDDLVLRFRGSSSSATIDNVSVILATSPDTTAPNLTSITDDKSGGPIEVGETVTYAVSFNEDMDAVTVTAADFGNAGTATYSIGTVTETADTSGVFLVPVTPTSTGTLRLQILAGAVIKDMGGNPLATNTAINDDTTITVNAASNPYVGWAAGPFDGTLSNTNPETDFDGGSLVTGLEWALGGDPTDGTDDNGIRPTVDASDANNVTFTFRRATAARDDTNTTIAVQYGGDMAFGTEVEDTGGGVTFAVTGNPEPGVEMITVTIPKSLAPGGKMFVRLKVTVVTP